MRVTVYEDRCIGSGICVLLAADVFDQRDDDGVVILLDGHPTEDRHESVRQAAARCPASVIELDSTDQQEVA